MNSLPFTVDSCLLTQSPSGVCQGVAEVAALPTPNPHGQVSPSAYTGGQVILPAGSRPVPCIKPT
jgi:hypothetical protein